MRPASSLLGLALKCTSCAGEGKQVGILADLAKGDQAVRSLRTMHVGPLPGVLVTPQPARPYARVLVVK